MKSTLKTILLIVMAVVTLLIIVVGLLSARQGSARVQVEPAAIQAGAGRSDDIATSYGGCPLTRMMG
jgi:hypothetical protein